MKKKLIVLLYCLNLFTFNLYAAENEEIITDENTENANLNSNNKIIVIGKDENYNNAKLINNGAKIINPGEDKLTTGVNSSVGDLLKNIAGVSVGLSSRDVIDIRGQGGESARRNVQVLLNSMPLNFLRTHKYFPGYNIIPANSIDELEVIAGGGAVIYGNGTQGGVINLATAFMSDKKKSNDISFGIGSFNSNMRGFNLSDDSLLNNKLTIGLSYSGENNKSYLKGEYANTDYYNIFIKYKINDNHSLGYSFSEYKEDGKVSDVVPLKKVKEDYYASNNLRNRDRHMLSNQMVYKGKIANVDINNNAFFNKTDWASAHDYKSDKLPPVWSDVIGNKLQVKVNYLDNGSFILLGNDYIYVNEVLSLNSANGKGKPGDDAEFTKQTFALFALNKTYWNNFYSTQGIRYNLDKIKRYGNDARLGYETEKITNNRNVTNYSSELSIGYENNFSNTWAKIESGFTAPNATNLLDTYNNKYIFNNIKYETFINYEIGNKVDITGNFDVSAILFYTDTQNEIDTLTVISYVEGYALNIGRTSRKGIEIGANYRILNNLLEIFTTGTYIDARLNKANKSILDDYNNTASEQVIKDKLAELESEEGKKLLKVAPLSLVSGLIINVNDNIKITNTINYLSKYYRNSDRTQALGDRALFDIDFKYSKKQYDVSLGIKNAFDKKYYTYFSSENSEEPASVIQGMGRYFYLSLKYKF